MQSAKWFRPCGGSEVVLGDNNKETDDSCVPSGGVPPARGSHSFSPWRVTHTTTNNHSVDFQWLALRTLCTQRMTTTTRNASNHPSCHRRWEIHLLWKR